MVCWLFFVLAALDFVALHILVFMASLRDIFDTLLLLWLCSVKSSKDGMFTLLSSFRFVMILGYGRLVCAWCCKCHIHQGLIAQLVRAYG